jgi:phosphatidylglycerol---prolipoprotein diacylglyceryl transferase
VGDRENLSPFFCSCFKKISIFAILLVMFYLSSIFWDPDPIAFYIPILNAPVLWYSLFFALGFFLAYSVVSKMLYDTCRKENSPQDIKKFIDSLVLYLFIGMLVGARLGHVFFYEWSYYKVHLHKIFYTWEGGLASHGATIGIVAMLTLFWHKKKKLLKGLTFSKLFDMLCIGIALSASSIRIGNFFNQEIIGTETSGPFGIVFNHPFEGYTPFACHPVQLYEALFYLLTFVTTFFLYKRNTLQSGQVTGLFFLMVFSFRFFIEPFKLHAGTEILGLYMGQFLSIPLILFGLYFFYKNNKTNIINKKYS